VVEKALVFKWMYIDLCWVFEKFKHPDRKYKVEKHQCIQEKEIPALHGVGVPFYGA
jgi:hypothetical protein